VSLAGGRDPVGDRVRRGPVGRVLGIDLGSVRIGVAVSDRGQRLATGLTTLTRSGDTVADHRALARLAAEEEVVALVVGLPRSLDGTLGPAALEALDEVAQLQEVVGVPVETYDERLTTVAATNVLRAAGVKGKDRRRMVDQVAAAVMLQSWIDRRQSRPAEEP
jgi:putative Holliday junction resolvase